jgi:hypothetical protein
MPQYDLGDGVNLRHYVYDRDGNLTDATVALTIYKPDGTTTGVVNQRTSLGVYDANTYVPLVSGDYRYKWVVSGAITDTSLGAFTVSDPAPAAYAELPLVKNQLGKITTDDRDEMIQAAIMAASRMVDVECGLWPGAFRADTVATARVVELAGNVRQIPPGYGRAYVRSAISVPPIASTTGLAVAGGSMFTGVYASFVQGTYVYGPSGAPGYGEPIRWLGVVDATIAGGIDSIQVTARWGWPTIPAQIEMATRLLAARLYRRKDSPQGVITSADWGAVRVSRTDPDVHALLFPFMTPGFA